MGCGLSGLGFGELKDCNRGLVGTIVELQEGSLRTPISNKPNPGSILDHAGITVAQKIKGYL